MTVIAQTHRVQYGGGCARGGASKFEIRIVRTRLFAGPQGRLAWSIDRLKQWRRLFHKVSQICDVLGPPSLVFVLTRGSIVINYYKNCCSDDFLIKTYLKFCIIIFILCSYQIDLDIFTLYFIFRQCLRRSVVAPCYNDIWDKEVYSVFYSKLISIR